MKNKIALSVILFAVVLMNFSCKKKADSETATLTLNSLSKTVSSTEGNFTVRVESTTKWTISGGDNWCSFYPGSGEGSTDVTISYQTNSNKIQRTATFSFAGANVSSQNFVLTQEKRNLASNPNYLNAVGSPFGITSSGIDIDFVDIDKDGDLDAFSYSGSSGTTQYMENTGSASNPVFAAFVTNPFGLNTQIVNLDFVDIDNDGDKDVFSLQGNGTIEYRQNIGSATQPFFSAAASNPFGIFGSSLDINLADIDNDGDKDLFSLTTTAQVVLYLNTGTAQNPVFSSPQSNPFGIMVTPLDLAIADLDDDDDLDMLLATSSGNVMYLQNTGSVNNAVFAAPVADPFGLAISALRVTVTDIDNDKDNDVFTIASGAGAVFFYKNTSL